MKKKAWEQWKHGAQSLLADIFARKVVNVVLVLSLAIAFFYPSLMVFRMHYITEQLSLLRSQRTDGYAISMTHALQPETFFNERLERLKLPKEQLAVLSMELMALAFVDGSEQVLSYGGIDERSMKEKLRLVSGRLPTADEMREGAKVAVVVDSHGGLAKVEAACAKPIVLNGVSYHMIGRVLSSAAAPAVYVPLGAMRRERPMAQVQSIVYAYGDTSLEEKLSYLPDYMDGRMISEEPLRKHSETIERMWLDFLRQDLRSGALVLAFSLGLVSLLLAVNLSEKRFRYGVHLSHGASKALLLRQALTESFLLALLGMGLVLLMAALFFPTLKRIFGIRYSLGAVSWSLAMALTSASLLGLLMAKLSMRGQVANYFRGRS